MEHVQKNGRAAAFNVIARVRGVRRFSTMGRRGNICILHVYCVYFIVIIIIMVSPYGRNTGWLAHMVYPLRDNRVFFFFLTRIIRPVSYRRFEFSFSCTGQIVYSTATLFRKRDRMISTRHQRYSIVRYISGDPKKSIDNDNWKSHEVNENEKSKSKRRNVQMNIKDSVQWTHW